MNKPKVSSRSFFMILMLSLFLFAFSYFIFLYIFSADDWALFPSNRHVYKNGKVLYAGDITDCEGVVLCHTQDGERVYNDDEYIRLATLHAVGDLEGYIATGVHTAMRDDVTGYDKFNGLYNVSGTGNNVELTIDSRLCVKAYQQLEGYCGTIAMYNYRTGELVCMASSPSFDVSDNFIASDEDEGVYMNRFLSSTFTPGSTFKVVTACAAVGTLDDAYEREYVCNGGTTIKGEWVACTGNHGTITLEDAFAYSCNSYFSQLTVDLGKDTLTEYAEKLGFNGEFALDGVKVATSSYNVDDAKTIDFAWSGIGQYKDLFNPLQYLTAIGAIANSGTAVKPYIISSIKNDLGFELYNAKIEETEMLDKYTADSVAELMDNTVEIYYTKERFGNLDVCAKTGTAEIGEDDIPHSVLVGFVDDTDMPFAFVAIVENGGSGNGIALNSVSNLLQYAAEIYK
ncbi:MAG: penicillin-binding protein [Oscillospiraceae bacterium]|nr:penicillin-binding protein [Oscillospiraceae bacterium]